MNTITKHSLRDDIGYWINRLRMQVHQAFEERLAQYDVTVAQSCILVTLYNEEAKTLVDLSRFIDVDKASISRVLDRLVIRKFVIREPGNDRRSSLLTLTPAAQDLVPKLIHCAVQNDDRFFGCLDNDETKTMKILLKKLLLNSGIDSVGGCLDKT